MVPDIAGWRRERMLGREAADQHDPNARRASQSLAHSVLSDSL